MAEVPLKFPCHPALNHRVMANQNKVMIIMRMMVTMATMATTTMMISFCVNSGAPAALPITVECFLPIGSPPPWGLPYPCRP